MQNHAGLHIFQGLQLKLKIVISFSSTKTKTRTRYTSFKLCFTIKNDLDECKIEEFRTSIRNGRPISAIRHRVGTNRKGYSSVATLEFVNI